jgi:hypothetical protein
MPNPDAAKVEKLMTALSKVQDQDILYVLQVALNNTRHLHGEIEELKRRIKILEGGIHIPQNNA